MLRRVFKVLVVLSLIGVGVVLAQAWEGLGRRATGERRARMERSPQWKNGGFRNPEEIVNDWGAMVEGMRHVSDDVSPHGAVEVVKPDPEQLAVAPGSGLRITWFGHSSLLIELDGKRVLTDPMWSERAGPLTWVGPQRYFPVLIPLDRLGRIDAVVISHDHYDHLDHRTIKAMKAWKDTVFFVPLGVGAHLEYWGIPPERLREVDWWEETKLGDVTIASTPVRHASGRQVFDRDATLWSGWAIVGPQHRVFFSGDTGLFTALEDIGEKYGPFDVTLFEIGQYHRAWPDWHLGPEQAVLAHRKLKGRVFFPMHWGLLSLAYHSWTEPLERALAEAKARGVTIVTPKPGQSVEPDVATDFPKWWPDVKFETGVDHPVTSGNVHFHDTL